ncbi:MAG: T9SS C-terminal target domain-containing protein [Bacteroidetes bacterium]|nr:MAG: T9SS C-terminal target domain-containing protein [Bacteroidota bacterium]MBL1145169.1 T9SS C-terminal target domain-containing protein [Bacteroidota bacterium]
MKFLTIIRLNLIKNSLIAFVLCLFLAFSNNAMAQKNSKIGFELKSYIENSEQNAMVPLLVEGNQEKIHELTIQLGGQVRLNIDRLFSLEIPAKSILSFSENEAVELIEFTLQPGVSLNDSMLIQTNVDSVIQQINPLYKSYTGKGVLLGVIDSGIELAHNDFKDSTGKTRILYVWDQGVAYNPSRKPGTYNYGVEWDSAAINAGISTHDDKASEYGHGSMVTGAAASNGRASGTYRGVAPDVNIIAVATDYNKPNWLQTVAESVDYIFTKADALGMPCVINASVGTYSGSHDGKDIAARLIDLLIKQKSGRSFVCAAGNAGNLKFHLRQSPQNDTVFTWFETHPALFSGFGGAYFEIWSDTSDFNHMQFAIGADRKNGNNFEFRGRSQFSGIKNKVNQVTTDSIISISGNHLAYIQYYVEESQGRYKIELAINDPDSSHYLYRLESIGVGNLDVWSSYGLYKTSNFYSGSLPSLAQFPEIRKYQKQDSLQTIVSSFTCLPSVITVGNYINRNTYVDYNGVLQNMNATPGQISDYSSLGPNRNNYLKPDISSAGDFMLSSGRIATMNQLKLVEPSKISIDGLHMRNGGTSMASPTVAGMVALYMEMCSNATYLEIKNKLIASAKQDQFTPNSPTPKWGNGKADAFQFLKAGSFSATLNLNSNQYCGVDSVYLSTNGLFNSYLWSNGDTSNYIFAKHTSTYSALVTNQNACTVKTNTIHLDFNPLPKQPIVQQVNDSLFLNAIGSYQWFYNNSPINGATLAYFNVNQIGTYFCNYTDTSTNCSINSDTINVISIGIPKLSQPTISIFPNPSLGKIYLNLNAVQSKKIYLRLYDLFGRLISEELLLANKQQIELDYSLISKGNYILNLSHENKVSNHLIVLE